MLEVGRTYNRIFSSPLEEETVTIRKIARRRNGNIYFVGSDWNHYDLMGRRGAYGIIDPRDTICRKFDLLVTSEMSLEEMLKECLN